jgi:hypothetical protein
MFVNVKRKTFKLIFSAMDLLQGAQQGGRRYEEGHPQRRRHGHHRLSRQQ